MDTEEGMKRGKPETGLGGWIYIMLLALCFLLYGLMMFFAIGDKGPPDWDFGSLPDTPGQSVYSTHSEADGQETVPQHVAERPPQAPVVEEGKGE
jgi:hypothetical protein